MVTQNFEDGIACYKDAPAFYAFAQEVRSAALRIRHQNIAAVIDCAPVDFFRHAVIIAAVACLHVINGNPHTLCHYRRQPAVRVSKNEQAVRPLLEHDALGFHNDLSDLLAERLAAHAQEIVWLSYIELLKENVIQVRIEILPRVYKDVLAQAVQLLNDTAQANYLRARAQDGHHLHGLVGLPHNWSGLREVSQSFCQTPHSLLLSVVLARTSTSHNLSMRVHCKPSEGG